MFKSTTTKTHKSHCNSPPPEQKPVTHGHLGEAKERLALHILNVLPMDALGFPLVLEHVETRALYNSLQPGIEQVLVAGCCCCGLFVVFFSFFSVIGLFFILYFLLVMLVLVVSEIKMKIT